ncbi:TPA: AIPR family protein [Streptococcus suis]|nr:AIPR family protein [Streptococcus suis]
MELNEFYSSFIDELNESRQINESTFEEEFFKTYVEYLIENDEIIGEPTFFHFEMPLSRQQKVSISGFSYNELDGLLYLMIVDDFELDMEVPTLTISDAERLYKRAKNFFTYSHEIAKYGEESNEAVTLASSLIRRRENETSIFSELRSIKILIFTEKKLSRNLVKMDDEIVDNVKISSQIVDIERIQSLSNSQKGKIDIEIELLPDQLIPAIKANETSDYESYLCNINGYTLATLYDKYGSRLIESNVRSFLQTRGKVNKGIRLTILKEPEKFFAYNNGLTCTAKEICYENGKISKINGLQIVNGGQTTASLANVLLNDKGGEIKLKSVSVPMKLNVIKDLNIEDEIVPAISRYANSQNKVSEVDLASNHPFHKKIEELSRKISTPPADGFSYGTYWYYERAAGQYAQETYKMPISQKKKFLQFHPKSQMFKKSDFAKYFSIYDKRPDIASKGGQSAFKSFTSWIINTWEKDPNLINQDFYKEMISNIILFKDLDKITKTGSGINGYKANINAYTLSYLYWYIECELNLKFNYLKIWQKQKVPSEVLRFLEDISYQVKDILTRVEGNVTEYAKRGIAWKDVKELVNLANDYDLLSITISKEDAKESIKVAKKIEKQTNDILDTSSVYRKMEEFPSYFTDLLNFITLRRTEYLPDELQMIRLLAANKILSDKQCKVALRAIEKAELDGFRI